MAKNMAKGGKADADLTSSRNKNASSGQTRNGKQKCSVQENAKNVEKSRSDCRLAKMAGTEAKKQFTLLLDVKYTGLDFNSNEPIELFSRLSKHVGTGNAFHYICSPSSRE